MNFESGAIVVRALDITGCAKATTKTAATVADLRPRRQPRFGAHVVEIYEKCLVFPAMRHSDVANVTAKVLHYAGVIRMQVVQRVAPAVVTKRRSAEPAVLYAPTTKAATPAEAIGIAVLVVVVTFKAEVVGRTVAGAADAITTPGPLQ